jgi:hypothetical protein
MATTVTGIDWWVRIRGRILRSAPQSCVEYARRVKERCTLVFEQPRDRGREQAAEKSAGRSES